ncbi:hypothetical protein BCR32DRAFT_291803 [Anaeromyces robustus]|jgi:hypothetical protein|uniref:Uncharacterized protein n=1 Tax=Anaeromyces robustus TaxID=1754192 RepID=A0A1Y1XDD2_9FUNG|nr:hypothetical protein BCR32DRAFT_291803 [Anaeromyces robustus]|eukprot:ORX83735.1 hypothetical protein BCR32DRAFT_291803 [Anaeromyces robustus]
MPEQKVKKIGISKKLKKGILSPCIKSPKVKETKDKHDLDSIDNGTLSFDSSKYLKKKNTDVESINTKVDSLSRRSKKTESPLNSEITESETSESYLKRKSHIPKTETSIQQTEQTEIIEVESSDSDDDVPLSQLSKVKNSVEESKIQTITNNIAEMKEHINDVKMPSIPMPVPVGSKVDDIKNSISIPTKMEPTKSEMASQIDTKVANQSIPMPKPTDSLKLSETDYTEDLSASETYIIEEIVTEEIINGKKRITTQTITRKTSPNIQPAPKTSNSEIKVQSIPMPIAVGSKMEEVAIPPKMTPTRVETTSKTEGIVEMPMTIPQPSVVKTDTDIQNPVETELNSPLSQIVDENEDRPSALAMPAIPIVAEMKQESPLQGKITNNVVSSPKLMEEDPANPHPLPEIPTDTKPSVEAGFNFNSSVPVEAGFNINQNVPVEAGFNVPVEPGFNFQITNEDNIPIQYNNNSNIGLSNSPPVPNLLETVSANRKSEKQSEQIQGYLNIPQPLPPSAIQDNQVIEDDKSDASYGSKKIVVSSPKVLTVEETIQFDENLANDIKIQQEEALKNEKPLGNISMPKTPSTYFKNNTLSDNEESKNSSISSDNSEIIKIKTPVVLPENIKAEEVVIPEDIETKKMKITIVNNDEDSDSDDDEKLFNIKQQYELKKKELEARINSIKDDTNQMKEDIKEEVQDIKEDIKDNLKMDDKKEEDNKKEVEEVKGEIKEEIKEDIKEVKEETDKKISEVKEEIKNDIVEIKEVKEEIKNIKEDNKEDIKEEIEEEIEDQIKTEEEEAKKLEETEKKKMDELKEQLSSSIKKHHRSMSNILKKVDKSFEHTKEHIKENLIKDKQPKDKEHSKENLNKENKSSSHTMSNILKKVDKSFEQTKEHIKENLNKDNKTSQKDNKEGNIVITTEKVETKTENEIKPTTESEVIETVTTTTHNYAPSDTSFQDTLMGSLKRTNGAKSIKSFFGFSRKDKKDKKNKKLNVNNSDDSIPEFPADGLIVNKASKKSSNSPFSSFKRFVSPLTNPKRRNSSASLATKNKITIKTTKETLQNDTTPELPSKSDVLEEVRTTVSAPATTSPIDIPGKSNISTNNIEKPLPVPIIKPIMKPTNDMNKVVSDIKSQAQTQANKFIIPFETLELKEKEAKKSDAKDDDKASVYSTSSNGSSVSESSTSSSSSSSSSSSDDEALGAIMKKKNAEKKSNDDKQNVEITEKANLDRNYTNIENDDFVNIMMVQRVLSSSVDRSNSPVPEVSSPPQTMVNPFAVDLETERKKSYSKPKAVVTAINPHYKSDSIDSPRSTILYKFEDKPKFEKPNLYKNEYASRSVGSLPIASEDQTKIDEYSSSQQQRMVELNLDDTTTKDNRKSAVVDSNLMQMFEDIHNLSLDDIATRYTKPSMIQCDIGPSFLDEVMGSLSMNNNQNNH